MKTYSQFQRISSVLLISLVLLELTGCYSTQTLTVSEISPSDLYLIHSGNSVFPVYNLVITEGILTGDLMTIANKNTNSIRNHIYLSNDSAVRNENNTLSVPALSITSIKRKINVSKRIESARHVVPVLVLGSLATVGIVYGFISFINNLFQE